MFMVAELEYDCLDRDEQHCQECDDRFRCWTSRNMTLPLARLDMRKDITSIGDEFEFDAECPSCFRCGNMVGSKVTIRAEHNQVIHMFEGVVIAQVISVEGDEPMKLNIRGVGNQI